MTTELNNVSITILAGGSGTRLWPRSRRNRPKQFLNLLHEELSLLQQTVQRVLPLVPWERIYILAGSEYALLIAEQLPQLPPANILIEASPRGTAPCLGLAALRLRERYGGESVMVSLHADHGIGEAERFRSALRAAVATARNGHLVTIGIVPTYAETGFGYIEQGQPLPVQEERNVYSVARFMEKPPLERAREFVASGRYYWNTGYFAWTLDHLLAEFSRQLPETYAQLQQVAGATHVEAMRAAWNQIQPVTIDVGIMEQARRVAVVPSEMEWNDVGSWATLLDILPRDAAENVVLGEGRHLGLGTSNSLIYSENRLVATIGLHDMIIVDTGDALLVLPKERAQEVSMLVRELRARGLERYL